MFPANLADVPAAEQTHTPDDFGAQQFHCLADTSLAAGRQAVQVRPSHRAGRGAARQRFEYMRAPADAAVTDDFALTTHPRVRPDPAPGPIMPSTLP